MIDKSTYPFYLTILRKDFRATFIPIMKALIVAGILICTILFGVFLYALMSQDTPVTFYDPNVDRFQYDFHSVREGDGIWIVDDGMEIDYIFEGISATSFMVLMILFMIFFIAFVTVYNLMYERIRKNGALRTITLYSVTVEDLVTAKTANGLLFTIVLYFLCIMPVSVLLLFFGVGFFRIISFSIGFVVVMSLMVILSMSLTGLAMKYRVKGIMNGPSASFAIMMLLFGGTTNVVVTVIARFLYTQFRWEYSRPFIANVMYLSPFHFLGRLYDFTVTGAPMSPWDFLWLLYFIPLIIVGYRAFKGVYPDLFIKETA